MFDCQWQVVERTAEVGDSGIRCDTCPGTEELDCLRIGERQNQVFDLAPDTQELAAGDKQRQVRASLEQDRQLWGDPDHLLEVVEQQQHLAFANMRGKPGLCPE